MSLPTNAPFTLSGIGTKPISKSLGVLSNASRVIITEDNNGSPFDLVMTIVAEDGTIISQRDITSDLTFGGSSVADTIDTLETTAVLPLPTGGFVLVWADATSASPISTDMFFRVYNATGTAVTATTKVDTTVVSGDLNRFEKIALLADGNFVISWAENGTANSIRIFKPDGTAVTGQIQVDTVTGDPGGSQGTHYVAASGTTTLVVYAVNSGDKHYWFTRFDETGTALADSAELSSSSWSGVQSESVATLSNGNFVIEYKLGTSQETFSILKPDGTFVVSDQATNNTSVTSNAGVYALATGGFVITSGGVSGAPLVGDIYDNTGSLTSGNVSLADPGVASSWLVASGFANGLAVLQRTSGTTATDSVYGHTAGTACFAAGTRISVRRDGARAEIEVEALRVGDDAVLASGATRPIIWLGHRSVTPIRHRNPENMLPVRVSQHAFAPMMPARELSLSPDHAVFVDGVLVPIRYLINGATVSRYQVPEITYWHVELDQHDVLLAEGMPCESYLDTGNRSAFANHGPAVTLHPDFALRIWDADACAKLVYDGPELTRVRTHLLERAAQLGHVACREPCLRVMADEREVIAEVDGGQVRVRLPPGVTRVRLISRTWVPAHMLANSTDTRQLGVALSGIRFDGSEVSLESVALLSGWNAPEPGLRWTDGDAALGVSGVTELAFNIAISGFYWREAQVRESKTAMR